MTGEREQFDNWRNAIAAVICAALLTACSSQTEPTVYAATATIFGQLRGADDRALAGVSVGAEVFTPNCSSRLSGTEAFVRSVTDSAGRYRLLLQLPTPSVHCIRLLTARQGGADSVAALLPGIGFRLSSPDSVRVDIRLP